MKEILFMLLLLPLLAFPASGLQITAPTVPESGRAYMPSEPDNLAEGIREILIQALEQVRPDLKEAAAVCTGVCAAMMLLSMIRMLPGKKEKVWSLTGVLVISGLLLNASGALINLAAESVQQISTYGKLLLPVMTAALAAQGGITTSAALYAGTALFDALLSALISRILIPLCYCYLAVCIAGSAIGEDLLKKLRDGLRWLITWSLKTVLYIFTGYISITGVVSGTTDAAALKAARLTISGIVPVVGGILSDASEAVLVSATTVRNTAGIYGMLAVTAVWIGPFLKIAAHYVLLRLTCILCSIFSEKSLSDLIQDFASVMGMMLAMTGSVSLMLLISLVCFMKGVG